MGTPTMWRAAALLAGAIALPHAAQPAAAVPARRAAAQPAPQLPTAQRPRLIVLTDIGNEPDDQMSLVRLLLYANELDIEAIIAVTSTWQKDRVSPEIARGVITSYGAVRPNLLLHADGWPTAQTLLARLSTGIPAYGMAGMANAPLSDGARAIINAADADDERPVWIALWGGANTLAQALAHVRATRSAPATAAFIARLRVHAISDQDDAGPWIRREFPTLFVIGKPSAPDGAEYASATWTGISGDHFYRNGAGADFTTVSNEWLDVNIRRKGPMGAHYPRYMFIMEGDTPSFLGLIPNGLQTGEHPNWGGWGGRYLLRQPYGEQRAIWTQGGDSFPRITSADDVDGHVSDQATIWRWRPAFQNDFAARMDWTIQPFALANHAPVLVVNGQGGTAPVRMDAVVGQPILLDGSASTDPDGNRLTWRWFQYREAGFADNVTPAPVAISRGNTARATITATATSQPFWLPWGDAPATGTAHIILAATDNGRPAITRYRRIILTVRPAATQPTTAQPAPSLPEHRP
ncbi:MAG: nucleoside hydrolase-like domain-containing protein [Sphingopyxis sp.]